MTNGERQAIAAAAQRIKKLASLENASFFPFEPERDAQVKSKVSCYMSWFEIVANELETLANATEKYEKENALHELQRYYVEN